jgi:hypothetical protein
MPPCSGGRIRHGYRARHRRDEVGPCRPFPEIIRKRRATRTSTFLRQRRGPACGLNGAPFSSKRIPMGVFSGQTLCRLPGAKTACFVTCCFPCT